MSDDTVDTNPSPEIEIIFRKSKRLVLRPLDESDAPLLAKWMNDPEVSVMLRAYLPVMKPEEVVWVQSLAKRSATNIVVMMVVDGVPIGTMGLHDIDHRHGTATTGAVIGEKAYQGKGYGVEAKMLLLEYAFNTLNLRKICSNVHEFNEFSEKYSLKCGYKKEGRRKDQHYSQGLYWDEIQLAVFRKDFMPLWDKFAEEHKGAILTKYFKKKPKK